MFTFLKIATDHFYWNVSAILNCFLCLDLVFMIRYPFSPPEKRVKVYLIITIL